MPTRRNNDGGFELRTGNVRLSVDGPAVDRFRIRIWRGVALAVTAVGAVATIASHSPLVQ